MSEHRPDQSSIVDELKQLGRQLTATMKVVASSDEVRSLGHEFKDGLRDAAQNVEEAWEKVRERDEVQRLQARAADVAQAFKTGTAQQEIREEIGEALHALNVRLSQLVARLQATSDDPATPATPATNDAATPTDEPYTGSTKRLDS